VFRGFFFFLAAALVPVAAHRIVWYGSAAIREASDLGTVIRHVANLLSGAISDRGAMEIVQLRLVVAMCQKFGRRLGRAKALVIGRHFTLSSPFTIT
jgi:hypothetical protein